MMKMGPVIGRLLGALRMPSQDGLVLMLHMHNVPFCLSCENLQEDLFSIIDEDHVHISQGEDLGSIQTFSHSFLPEQSKKYKN